MDVKIIRQLTRLMQENVLVEVEVESPELKVRLAKANPSYVQHLLQPGAPLQMPATPAAPVAAQQPAAPVDEFAGCRKITSPIPGTVYLKPNPESPLYTQVGERVEDGQIVCLVEAMKVFNEIKCEGCAGVVKKICVEDGQAVEYGTVLFLVA
jgi:acetyl-CoA carboxylase biotin carboxyl carrier protein